MKKVALTFATLALAIGAAVAGPLAAHAGGTTSTGTHGGPFAQNVLTVWGSGTYVTTARVLHSENRVENQCGFQGRVTGVATNGSRYQKTFGYNSGCTPAPYYNQSEIERNFMSGTYVAGHSYHDGQWTPGSPNIKIS